MSLETAGTRIAEIKRVSAGAETPAVGLDMRLHGLLWLGLIVGAGLLLALPLAKPVWDDELDSIMQGSKPFLTILLGASDTQPPLHFLLLRFCKLFFGGNLAAFRLVSALPAVASLWYVYLLGKRLTPAVGVLAVWLAALSPALVLFDRMARYHGLLAMLTTMVVYYALTALETGRRREIIAFGLLTFLMLMTYYLSLFVPLALLLFFLPQWRRQPHLRPLLASLAGAICAFLPSFLHGLLFAQHNLQVSNVEDPAMSLGISGFVRRLGLPLYSFCFGETISPWKWAAVLPGAAAVSGAFFFGVKYLRRKPDLILVLVCAAVLVLSAAATSGRLGTGQTVGSMSKRVSFVLPLFSVILSAGLLSLRLRQVRCAGIVVILGVFSYALSNYWRDQQFLNQNYVARWDQAITLMQNRQWGQNTLVVSCADPALHYSLDHLPQPVPHVNITSASSLDDALRKDHPRYLWVVGRDRGDQTAVSATEELEHRFGTSGRLCGTYGLMPRSAEERLWLEKLLKRPAAPFYIDLFLYDMQPPPGHK